MTDNDSPTRGAIIRIAGRTLQVLVTEDQIITQEIIYLKPADEVPEKLPLKLRRILLGLPV